MLTVITPAEDVNLLTVAELRAAVNVTDGSQDVILADIGLRVSAAIARACAVEPAAAVAPAVARAPTLRAETLQEVLRLDRYRERLRLARVPIVSVAEVVEDGVELAADAYEIDGHALLRLSNGATIGWPGTRVSVTYEAGWAEVPEDLKLAAAKLAQSYYFEGRRDPGIRSREMPDVSRVTYQAVGATVSGSAFPEDVTRLLAPYRAYA